MNEYEKVETLARTRERNQFPVVEIGGEGSEAINRYTMFAIGAAAFFTGFWAMACLANALFITGPWGMIRQLFSAITGN